MSASSRLVAEPDNFCLQAESAAPALRRNFARASSYAHERAEHASASAQIRRENEQISCLSGAERDEFVLSYLPEVRHIARRIHERLPAQVPLEDLVNAGIIGLMEALQRFDDRRGVPLSAYARFRIRGAILDSLRLADWSPRSLRKHARALEGAYDSLSSALGRAPLETELAGQMGLELLALHELLGELHGLNMGSLEMFATEDNAAEAHIPNPEERSGNPFSQCLRSQLSSRLPGAIDALDEQERQVVVLYYFDELTMKEIGARLGVTHARISQIHSAALVRLREGVTFGPCKGDGLRHASVVQRSVA